MSQYNFTKTSANIEQLTIEINNNSTIIEDVDYIRYKKTGTDNLKIFFSVDLDAGQQTELGNIVTAHTASVVGSKNFFVEEYNKRNFITKEIWYETDNGDGTYSDKIEETTYFYDTKNKNKLLYCVIKNFLKDGTEIDSKTLNYYSDDNKRIVKE